MKKSSSKIIYLFAVLLLLTSCGVNIKNTENISSANEQKNDKNAFYISGELPDIGEFSGIQQRFYEEYTPEFIPSDEYGEIYPYVGKSKLYITAEVDFEASQIYFSYGFCTKDGKIVMDANDKIESVSYNETSDGFGYYTAREIDDESPEDYDVFEILKTFVIPKNGKWCLELDNRSWISSAGGGIFSVTEYPGDTENVNTYIYDYDKNLLLTLDGIESAGALSNGLILTTKWFENGAEYNFIDINGKKILGPYSRAQDFNEHGLTCVGENQNDLYLINSKGERVTNTPYSNIYYETGVYDPYEKNDTKVFLATRADNSKIRDVYSADGKLLGTAEGGSYVSLRFPDNDDIYYGYSNYDHKTYTQYEQIWKKLSTGELFVSNETGKCPLEYYGTDNIYVSPLGDNETTVVFDYTGKTICKISDFNSFVSLSPNEKYLVYTSGKNESYYDELKQEYIYNDNTKLNIYDLSRNKILRTYDASGHVTFSRDSRYATVYLYNDMDIVGLSNTLFMYDLESDKVLFENALDVRKFDISDNEYFNVCTPSSNTLYDGDLNVIIKTYNE